MTKPYREYLTGAEREQLDVLLQKTQTAIVESKRALATFATVNSLIKQDKLAEAKTRLESLTDSAFLSKYQLTRIAEVLRQIGAQITDDKALAGKVKTRNLLATAKLEKIAEEIRKPSEQLKDQNEKIADIYRQSMDFYRAGKLEKARAGFVKVAGSGLIPPAMKKDVDGRIARIDSLLPGKITAQSVGQDKPELIAVVEPKVIKAETRELRFAQPKLAEAEAAESADSEPAPAGAEDAEPEETAPKVPSPVTGEGTYIERKIRERNILRTYTATVVNDAADKAARYMAEDDFAKARQAVNNAEYVVNENQIDLGDELFKAHSTRLRTLMSEIAAREAAKARLLAEEKRAKAAEDQRQRRTLMEIERENRIAELLENAKAYQKQQRYEAALGQLKSLLLLDPQHDEALTMKDLLEDNIYFRKQLDIEKETNRQTADVQLKTDQSRIPYADEVTYPKNWREISEKPTRQPDKPIGLDPADAAVYEQLEEIVNLSNLSQAMSFEEVVMELENSVEPPLQIQPNWKDLLEFADLEPTTPAMMDSLTGIKLRKALEVLVAGVSSDLAIVDYVVDEGVIVIATEDALPQKMVTRVYDITDLVGQPSQGMMGGGMMGMMGGMMGGGMMGGGMMGGMMGGGMMGGGMMGGGYGGGGLGGFGGGGLGGFGGGGLGGLGGGGLGGYGGGGLGGGGGFGGGGYGGGGYGGGGLGGFGGGGMMGGGYGGGMMGGGMMGGGMMGGGMMGGGMMGGMMGGGGMMSAQQAQSLEMLIQESIDPESWFDLSDTGEGTITPFPIQQPKKLSVYNTHEVHQEIDKLLMALRKSLGHQVSIEARFLVVTENFLEDIGLDVDFSVNAGTHWGQITFEQDSAGFTDAQATSIPGSLGGLGASASVGGGYGSILDDLQVSFLLRATQAHRDAKSMNAPLATVLSGESASFMINRSAYLALPPTQQGGISAVSPIGGTGTTTGGGLQPNYIPATSVNSLTITPIITHDKKNVLLNISTMNNEFLGLRTSTVETPLVGGAQPGQVVSYEVQTPDQETSSLNTRVSVPDNGTLLLGGQRVTQEIETEAGVPILSKLPLVGRLFRNRSNIKDSKILLILVKPVIILQEEREAEAIAAMEGEL
jgi:Flp pilus assembly secretin CpaC